MNRPSGERQATLLLHAWSQGDQAAGDQLMALLYAELRKRAAAYLRRERPGHTLQPTALVHEAYVRLVDQRGGWQNRTHFIALAAQMMRRILVDHARRRLMAKRSGRWLRVEFEDANLPMTPHGLDVLAIDDLLTQLAAFDLRKSRVIELRFFAGLSLDETAAALQISRATVDREWRTARAWLNQQLSNGS
jgi:RNA polymerase sigma-70 factor, ECF subfamily